MIFGLDDPDNIFRAVSGEEMGTVVNGWNKFSFERESYCIANGNELVDYLYLFWPSMTAGRIIMKLDIKEYEEKMKKTVGVYKTDLDGVRVCLLYTSRCV